MEKFSPFWTQITQQKKQSSLPRIVFTDFLDPRVHQAISIFKQENIIQPVLVAPQGQGNSNSDTFIPNQSEMPDYHKVLIDSQQKFHPSDSDIQAQLNDSLFLGIAMLLMNKVDGLVGGSLRSTADIVKASLRCVGGKDHRTMVSGQFLMESNLCQTSNGTPFLLADCAVMPDPSPRALAAIAISAAESYTFFTKQEPIIAFLSFSTRDSAQHALVDRIKEAVALVKKMAPHLNVDGELQADAALSVDVAKIKGAGDSGVAGRANVLIFPTLEAGNIGYKLIQRFSKTKVAGPLLWGLKKPVSDLSRGCTVQEIVDTTYVLAQMIGDQN